jgi:preprotein translocase subunit SecD
VAGFERHLEIDVINKLKTPAFLISGCLIALAAFATNSSAAQLVEMRLVLDKFSDGAEQLSLDKEKLFVQKSALLDQTDLRSVAVSTNTPIAHPQVGLVFQFTEQGWKRFSESAHQNNGKRLAVIIDGQIYAAPVIRPDGFFKFHDHTLEFHGTFTEQVASELAVKIDKALQK